MKKTRLLISILMVLTFITQNIVSAHSDIDELPHMHTVTFDGNGEGAIILPENVTRTVRHNSAIGSGNMPPGPTREGYTFTGWNIEPEGSGINFSGNFNVIGDTTVFAQWQAYPTEPINVGISAVLRSDTDDYFVQEGRTITYFIDIENIGSVATEELAVYIDSPTESRVYYVDNLNVLETKIIAFSMKTPNTPDIEFVVSAFIHVGLTNDLVKMYPIKHMIVSSRLESLEILKTSNFEEGRIVRVATDTSRGSVIEYTTTVKNTGLFSGNVIIEENIPNGTVYIDNSLEVKINGILSDVKISQEDDLFTIHIASLKPDEVITVTLSVEVDKLNDSEFEKTYENTAVVNGVLTNTVSHFSLVFIEQPSGARVQEGDTITYVMDEIQSTTTHDAFNFAIENVVPLGLNLVSMKMPAFTEDDEISYIIRYKTNLSNDWMIATHRINANQEFTYVLPNLGSSIRYTNVELFFGEVPSSFAVDSSIEFEFLVTGDSPTLVLKNQGIIKFDLNVLRPSN